MASTKTPYLWTFNVTSDNTDGNISNRGAPTLEPVTIKKNSTASSTEARKAASALTTAVGVINAITGGNKVSTSEPAINSKTAGSESTSSKSLSVINIVDDFAWTHSPKQDLSNLIRKETPNMILRESYLKTNSSIAQAVYYALGAIDRTAYSTYTNPSSPSTSGVREDEASVPKNGGDVFQEEEDTTLYGDSRGIISSVSDTVSDTATNAANAAGSVIKSVFDSIKNKVISDKELNQLTNYLNEKGEQLLVDYEAVSNNSSVMQPYDALYLTKPSGFIYYMPYFQNKGQIVTNGWEDTATGLTKGGNNNSNPLGTIMANVAQWAVSNTKILNMVQPGAYIESPKFYNYASDGEEYNTKFPLLNTESWEDVSKNWQFLFMLMYQNSPNRLTRDLIHPPVIYEVNIPGIWYTPYAFISGLNVEFLGTRRQMKIPIPVTDGVTNNLVHIDTIVPEAYVVDIRIKSLVPKSRNMLYAMLNRGNIVTTYARSETNTFNEGTQGISNTINNIRNML